MDGRRLGHAQRRRNGIASNIYSDTLNAPSFAPGDEVKASGRYKTQTVEAVLPNMVRPEGDRDGHGYVVRGGKSGRQSIHSSDQLTAAEREIIDL